MKRVVFCGAMLVLLAVPTAFAMPDAAGNAGEKAPASGRFAAADADKDGFLSREEFAAAFSGLKPEAFTLLDKDGDGRISAGEWGAFSMGHGGSTDSPHGGRDAAGGESLPVEPVPQNMGK